MAKGQPETMPKDIEELVYSYMKKPETLILCVAQGNNDLANSPIKHAKKFDLNGDRTIGVVTKMDLSLDDTTLQKDIVDQPRYPLKNGWVGVINRTDTQIEDGITIEDSIKDETNKFKSHIFYNKVDPKFLGIETLNEKMVKVLSSAVQKVIPSVKAKIDE